MIHGAEIKKEDLKHFPGIVDVFGVSAGVKLVSGPRFSPGAPGC